MSFPSLKDQQPPLGPTDHKRSVGHSLFLPEVYNQLFSFAHIKRETVVLAP